ncbi:MAG TPA: hypothetical protein VK684_11685 [Edaphobacter sp.]|nr:hypothetical protein [Edaphobacter sp.]
MGKTQQTFAVEVLKTAIGTVARYETSDPPQGEVLLRLRDIAHEHGFHEIGSNFELLYREEIQNRLPYQLVISDATQTREARGHLSIPLYGEHEISGAHSLLLILAQLNWPDPKIKQNAVAAISSLRDAARKHLDPATRKIQDSYVSRLSVPQPQPSAKKTKRSK